MMALFENHSPAPLQAEIAELRRLWEQARRCHVSLPIGCACGAPVAHITPGDFERDLIDYLAARHARSSEAKLILAHSAEVGSLVELMSALESGAVPGEFAASIIADLRRSLRSFASGGRQYTAARV